MCRRIERAIAIELIDAIYRAEGWTPVEGERRVKRANELYSITADPRRNRYVAVRKDCPRTGTPA